MKNKNIKVIDEHNIDRDANVMFALELDGSEYVVYWISRDEESNNVFVSKVLKNLDGTNNMLNIDDDAKKNEIAEIVKTLISSAVSDQNDKMTGVSMSLSNGKTINFVSVSFNKEQQISVSKTYITTVKKEVTKVAETYYDVAAEEQKIESVLTAVPVVDPVVAPATPVAETPVAVMPQPVVAETPLVQPVPTVVEPVVAPAAPVAETPVAVMPQPVVVETPLVQPVPAVVEPVVAPVAPVVETPAAVVPQPVVVETPAVNNTLVFNASKETNLNAALGEVASSATIPVEDINSVREFGVETPVVTAPQPEIAPAVAPAVQPATNEIPVPAKGKAGFANSKFFMVVAISFFLASCVFLGYEVFNYFQLVK